MPVLGNAFLDHLKPEQLKDKTDTSFTNDELMEESPLYKLIAGAEFNGPDGVSFDPVARTLILPVKLVADEYDLYISGLDRNHVEISSSVVEQNGANAHLQARDLAGIRIFAKRKPSEEVLSSLGIAINKETKSMPLSRLADYKTDINQMLVRLAKEIIERKHLITNPD
ncbi:MAG: hypothetical protein HOA17_07100 [Candidatus Melainabacteria bacterium]|jgi:hypothetical protein|nr:hypothetical protein [Candidatus Melainabacteria bacterium]